MFKLFGMGKPPQTAEFYLEEGIRLGMLGWFEDACKKFAEAVRHKPDNAKAYYSWGVALGGLGKHEEECEKYAEAVKHKPDYAEAYYAWGVALGKLGRHEEECEKCAEAVKHKPELERTKKDLASARRILKELRDPKEDLVDTVKGIFLLICVVIIAGAFIGLVWWLWGGCAQPIRVPDPSRSSRSQTSEYGERIESSRASTSNYGQPGSFVFGSEDKEALDRELRSAFGSDIYLGIRVNDPTGVFLRVDFTGIPDKDMGRRIAVAVKNAFLGLFPEASSVVIHVYDIGLEREMGSAIETR